MAEDKDIKYNGKEFSDFKSQLVEFAKNYYPDTYNDFSTASPGMMFIEMAAYVGDILSFYQDTQIQETFLQYAKNPSNLFPLAYMMGYRPKVASAAEVELEVSQTVDAISTGGGTYGPNWDQALHIEQGAIIQATVRGTTPFTTLTPVNFSFSSSYDPTYIQIQEIEGGIPYQFKLTKKVKARSGTSKTIQKQFTVTEKFNTLKIEDTGILGIESVVDNNGNTWYEVPFLGQDTIFQKNINEGVDKNAVPYYATLLKVNRRFVSRFTSSTVLELQFGAGITSNSDSEILPDPTNTSSIDNLGVAYDPSNFLFTQTYGLAPAAGTILTITYKVGNGVEANAPSGTITDYTGNVILLGDTTKAATLSFTNPLPATGGRDGDTIEELRQNSLRSFAEQQRAVTLQDFTIRAMSLPALYGSIAKAFTVQESNVNIDNSLTSRNPLAISLYILSYDSDKKLIYATDTLKQNLKNYLSEYKLLTDAIDIKDAFIINIGVRYEIINLPNYPVRDILASCNTAIRDYLDTSKQSINQPINISGLYAILSRTKGVQLVKNIEIVNKSGGNYSTFSYDVKGATKNNTVYPSLDPCIFELKYPDLDIEGRTTTL